MDLNDFEDDPYTVAELTRCIQQSLEHEFPALWVEGEVSDLARPRSGHAYFTLKDAEASIRCVMWRSDLEQQRYELFDGAHVHCGGGVSVYPPRGSYQLMVRRLYVEGEGELEAALRALQSRLSAEGLFAPERKRPIPRRPKRVAVVTSPTGAAVRDFLQAWRARWRCEVVVVPTRVQGPQSAGEIARAIGIAGGLAPRPDVVVVTRGGGSLEDLWAFNEEVVVRATVRSPIPVVSAIGHEIDVTLCDLAADARALTPTDAARLAADDVREVREGLAIARGRLAVGLRRSAESARVRVEELASRRALRRPLERLRNLAQRLDEIDAHVRRAMQRAHAALGDRAAALAARLHALSPLNVLARGYSITRRGDGGPLKPDSLGPGDAIASRLERHTVFSRVESVKVEPRASGDASGTD